MGSMAIQTAYTAAGRTASESYDLAIGHQFSWHTVTFDLDGILYFNGENNLLAYNPVRTYATD